METNRELKRRKLATFFGSKYSLQKLTLVLTNQCNLACSYCYTTDWKRKEKREMSLDVACAGVDLLLNEARGAQCSLIFSGGEPLLRFDLIKEIIRHAEEQALLKSKKMFYSFITNGTLLTSQVVDFIQQFPFEIAISIDGVTPEACQHRKYVNGVSSLSDILVGVENAVQSNLPFSTRITVTRQNMDMYETTARLLELGVSAVRFLPAVQYSDSNKEFVLTIDDLPEYFKEMDRVIDLYREKSGSFHLIPFHHYVRLLQQKKTFGDGMICTAGAESGVLTPEGNFYACADILDEPSIYLGSLQDGIQKKFVCHQLMMEKCHDCEIQAFCPGGCYARFFKMSKDYYLPDEAYCQISKYYHQKAKELITDLSRR